MDDVTAFERQVADEIFRIVGPARPVADAAIYEAITATDSARRRFRSVYGAMKFVVAGVIVALFGGFLMTGVLTTKPDDESVPAVGTSASAQISPSPAPEPTSLRGSTTRSDLLPGLDLVTEKVEPGVSRVISDGVRDLARTLPDYDYSASGFRIAAGSDGSVWMLGPEGGQRARFHGVTGLPDQGDFFRLGDALPHWLGEHEAPPHFDDVEVGPDGVIWASGGGAGPIGLWKFDGRQPDDAWERVTPDAVAVAVGPDGTVWTASQSFDKTLLSHSQAFGEDPWTSDVVPWPVADADPVAPDDPNVAVHGLWASDEGGVWLLRHSGERTVLSRLHGTDWQHYEGPHGGLGVAVADGGPDGSVWLSLFDDSGLLARFDRTGWTTYDGSDGVPNLRALELPDRVAVAPDGSVWLNPVDASSGCGGLHHFDGTTWVRFLEGTCIYAMDVAKDGAVWLRGGTFDIRQRPSGSPVETYVIEPDAAAATESPRPMT